MTIGIVLSGGGAKADFEVGALRFLYDHGVRPDVLCGVSAGAMNAARLASVPAPAGAKEKDDALRALEQMWRSLRNNSDMWVTEPWLVQLNRGAREAAEFAALALVPNPVPLQGIRAWAMLAKTLPDLAALAVVPDARSLYNIGPIEARLNDPANFAPDLVRSSGMLLRLGTVSLTNGRLRYVTEKAEVLERDGSHVMAPPQKIPPACQQLVAAVEEVRGELQAAQQDLVDAARDNLPTDKIRGIITGLREKLALAEKARDGCLATTPSHPEPLIVNLRKAVLASAAIPMFFPAVSLGLGDHYVDGGVREILPIAAAVDAGATEIYAISVSHVGVEERPVWSSPAYEQPRKLTSPMLADLLMRTMDLFLDEILLTDADLRPNWPAKGLRLIAPTLRYEVHDLMTVEPGLIDINMAYGYMRAWDAVVGVKLGEAGAAALAALTDAIVEERKAIWELEFAVNGHRPVQPHPRRGDQVVPVPDGLALPELRRHKRRLAELIDQRIAGGGGVPVDKDRWIDGWERHEWLPLIGSPWDRFVSLTGTIDAASPPLGTEPVAATAFPSGRVEVVAVGSDTALNRRVRVNGTWSAGWDHLGGSFTSAPDVTAWDADRLEVFARGTDRSLYHGSWQGSQWLQGGWENLGGGLRSRPEVVVWGPNRLDVFALGPDRQMLHKAWDGSAWRPSMTDWSDLGGEWASPPRAVAWEPGRLDVFALGLDGSVWHRAWDGSGSWQPPTAWAPLGGVFAHRPAVVSWEPGRLDLFAVSIEGDMRHKAWDGGAWRPGVNDWNSLGGVFTGAPTAVSWEPGRLDVFALGLDRAVHHKAWDASNWRPAVDSWDRMGGSFATDPVAVSPGPNRLNVFGLGLDRAMYHKEWDGTAWRPSQDTWEGLGGTFAS